MSRSDLVIFPVVAILLVGLGYYFGAQSIGPCAETPDEWLKEHTRYQVSLGQTYSCIGPLDSLYVDPTVEQWITSDPNTGAIYAYYPIGGLGTRGLELRRQRINPAYVKDEPTRPYLILRHWDAEIAEEVMDLIWVE